MSPTKRRIAAKRPKICICTGNVPVSVTTANGSKLQVRGAVRHYCSGRCETSELSKLHLPEPMACGDDKLGAHRISAHSLI